MSASASVSATAPASAPRGWLPRTLFARVTLLMVLGIAVAQALAFVAIRQERMMALRELMMSGIERDIATGVAILDRLPAAERAAWLARLERPNYRFAVGSEIDPDAGPVRADAFSRDFTDALSQALRPFRIERLAQLGGSRYEMLVRLSDGSALTVHARRVDMPVSAWVLWVLAAQLAVLALCAWLAVRLVTRPLGALAAAADELGPEMTPTLLDEAGPAEVARAARAFNAMQTRIAGYTAERVEILAAISHDLQTPITRMRLRADLMADEALRDKFRQDLGAMHALVREGVTYARTLHGTSEPPIRLDADALLASIVGDYEDAGEPVTLEGRLGAPVVGRPQALKRILVNLVDNALAFGGQAEVRVSTGTTADETQDMTPGAGPMWSLSVLDRGPGIPEDQLQAVFKPFHRLETSRNRDTGGTGLGLAISQQLATAMGGTLTLRNRPDGGLEARLSLPRGDLARLSTGSVDKSVGSMGRDRASP
ncbi:MAG: HAMP domain-containing protein [Mitsuaria chitosanitabida]|jgi:signal transduction histidine kinase|uniref:ATP-binding protein n=1 Tax=Roseateles chitosanitabidus TaxID=65048 RepID=UPI001B0E813D|nr:ATP-binding protein [Roseateles chitosanitabidus]MBO9686006.1 HAMP domain-containing protein [Roseateles chitosanitabidus]